MVQLLTEAVREGLHHRLHAVIHKKTYPPGDVAAGRAYVAAYVEFIHYVERLYGAAVAHAHEHYKEATKEKHAGENADAHAH